MKTIFYCILFVSFGTLIQTEKKDFNQKDKQKIDDLVSQFDIVVKKYYPNEKINISYKKYLTDLTQRKVNPQIIQEENTKKIFLETKKTSTFLKVWKKKSSNKSKKHIINFDGIYMKHLIASCQNESFKKFLKDTSATMNEVPNLSPFILASTYAENLKDEDYNLKNVKQAVSILFYYDIMEQFIK